MVWTATTTSVIAAAKVSQPARHLVEQRLQAGSADRSQNGVRAIDRGNAKSGSHGGRSALTRGKTDEVAADSSNGHRDSQAGHSAGEEVADHGLLDLHPVTATSHGQPILTGCVAR